MHSTYRINAQDFYDFDRCPHRVYLNRFGDPKEKLPHSDFLNMLFENALTLEHDVISDGMECLRVKTETTYLKRRAIKALRSVADFLESKLDAAEVSPPCDPLPSCEEPNHPANRRERETGRLAALLNPASSLVAVPWYHLGSCFTTQEPTDPGRCYAVLMVSFLLTEDLPRAAAFV